MVRSVIAGCGAYLPANRVTNDDLAQRVDTSDAWIRERSGIVARHFAAEGELTSDLAAQAARAALADAGLEADAVDLIVLATATPDKTFPATAVRVQTLLGCRPGVPAFDVQAVCSGFLYALGVADSMVKVGLARTALVIGAETFSRLLDFNDRTTCVLFGDGAGAVVLQASDASGGLEQRGIHSVHLHADGRYQDLLYVDGGPSSTQTTGFVRMHGKEVFRHAVTNLSGVVTEALEANGLSAADLDWIVPHQANQRILDGTARKLEIDPARVISTIALHANTSAASVPLAMSVARADGRLKAGDLVLLEALGGGFTWGAALVRL
ncbi:beta-ketoacyl-ACP synthase III [Pararhodospirillum photometricum]|uniref:Beta-ketoacyl-[acyl-carrier-protein] synthase III n=1 Tax=Pararhodospirillum photometricum DSM 122 TaxID=1150469 RepID=H6SRK1_PARPM|nr:beta-ketoacyl-ACP synthase III [Pararhodospirillum photometricum]CCG07530.1 3-oxoacyl-[acyl-carrier-protein] synthase 3 [Pararhodospirillum photometricum DSM 122]